MSSPTDSQCFKCGRTSKKITNDLCMNDDSENSFMHCYEEHQFLQSIDPLDVNNVQLCCSLCGIYENYQLMFGFGDPLQTLLCSFCCKSFRKLPILHEDRVQRLSMCELCKVKNIKTECILCKSHFFKLDCDLCRISACLRNGSNADLTEREILKLCPACFKCYVKRCHFIPLVA